MLTNEDVNALGQILNHTWGASSTVASPTMSITTGLSGDTLTVKYVTIVHLASDRNLRDQVRKFEDESIKLTSDYISNVKKEFKKSAGRSIKIKEKNTTDSVEMITTSPYAPRKTAYYRRNTVFTCE